MGGLEGSPPRERIVSLSLPAGWPKVRDSGVILCVGAHSDDIEIGCAGTLIRLAEANPGIQVVWAVLAPGSEDRRRETVKSASTLLSDLQVDLRLGSFRERFLSYDPSVKEFFDQLGKDVDPELVLAPRLEDRHQDHSHVAELAWNTFRKHAIWEYEIPKYEGDLGQPNLFVPVSEEVLNRKVEHILSTFPSQSARYWFKEDTFTSLAVLRGVEARAESGFAEGFSARKLVLS